MGEGAGGTSKRKVKREGKQEKIIEAKRWEMGVEYLQCAGQFF